MTTPESRSCDEGYKMDIIMHEGQHWFRAADVTRHLAYSNGRQAVMSHVKQKDKTTKDFLVPGGDHSVYVNENGVRALIRRSRKAEADDFEAWLALKMDELKGSGGARRSRNRLQIQLLNEKDLHYKVVEYLRRFYPYAVLMPGLGELQDTEEKRLDAWAKGYTGGTCDLMIMRPGRCAPFGIEFKTPLGTGILRENQQKFLEKLQEVGCVTLVSNDYDEICRAIMEYFS